jgi:hypothetical protein
MARAAQGRKTFFFGKKKQKTFFRLSHAAGPARA